MKVERLPPKENRIPYALGEHVFTEVFPFCHDFICDHCSLHVKIDSSDDLYMWVYQRSARSLYSMPMEEIPTCAEIKMREALG